MSNYYVYGHYTKDTKELFYIGEGSGSRSEVVSGRNLVWYELAQGGYDSKKMLVGFKTKQEALKYEKILQEFHKPRACLYHGGGSTSGVLAPNYGRKESVETREKKSKASKGRVHEMVTCPHCGKEGSKPPMTRFHFDNCRSQS